MKREEKAKVIEVLTERLKSRTAVLVDYQGINVAQSTELRRRSREAGVEFVVAKNTLTQIAAGDAGLEGLDGMLAGPTALAFGDDPVASAKLMADFADAVESFAVKGGVLEGGQVVGAEQVIALSKLPGREQLIAQVVGGMSAPIAGLVNVLNGTVRNIAVVLSQIAEQKNAQAQ